LSTAANIRLEGGKIEIGACGPTSGQTSIGPHRRNIMGRTGKKSELPDKQDSKSKQPPPAPIGNDEIEDGDIATPKRDLSDTDDEPL
jgi:hypothetical protein